MAVVEGTLGPLLQATGSAPEEGTDEVQTLTIGGTPTGGTFQLEFKGCVTPPITWIVTDATLVAHVAAALEGVAEVQSISFLGIASGKFRLRFREQETAAITWSGTNNTLRDNVDTALEALSEIGTSGCVTAVSVNGTAPALVTLTVTFAVKGPQLALQMTDNRLVAADPAIEPTVTVARTVEGSILPTIGPDGVSVAEDSLTSGVGTIAITFDGANLGKRVQPLITVADNSMTGSSPTAAVTEATPGVDAFGLGLGTGGDVTDTNDGAHYVNLGTAAAPTYEAVTTS